MREKLYNKCVRGPGKQGGRQPRRQQVETREQNPRDQAGRVCPQAAYTASSPTKGPGGSRRKMGQGQPAWRAGRLRAAVLARTQVTAAQGRVCGTRTSEEVTGKDAEHDHRTRKPSGRQTEGPAGSTQPQQRGRDALRYRPPPSPECRPTAPRGPQHPLASRRDSVSLCHRGGTTNCHQRPSWLTCARCEGLASCLLCCTPSPPSGDRVLDAPGMHATLGTTWLGHVGALSPLPGHSQMLPVAARVPRVPVVGAHHPPLLESALKSSVQYVWI